MTHQPDSSRRRPLAWSLLVFFAVSAASMATVAGPGLTWDEPAYRASEVRLQEWITALWEASSFSQQLELLSADAIDFYFEFNRFGPNFHPPLASYLHLATSYVTRDWIDDLSSRRIASGIELGMACAALCWFLTRRYGPGTGIIAGFSLALTPRVFGDSHIAGTDIPILLFWTLASVVFPSALHSRRLQLILAVLLALLSLVKFSGVMIALPLAAAWAFAVIARPPTIPWLRWSAWSVALILPFLLVLVGYDFARDLPPPARALLGWGVLLWPPLLLVLLSRSHSLNGSAMELPWRIWAYTPLVAVILNPTWWHDPLISLASYLDLSLHRRGALPDIEIFYRGQQFTYSLPWENAWVLIAITVPFGTLFLALLGIGRTLFERDRIPLYLLLHAITLPVVRMFPVPAHDGVRLFLPTFAFVAAFAGIGSQLIARRHLGRWALLFLLGPLFSAWEVARIHPFELSYYNRGLAWAQRAGFEPTYWYDAVTRSTLEDLNRLLPQNASLALPSPRINPEVFVEHQSKGRLRGDLRFDQANDGTFPFMLLLTHSSKADPFTRLLYGMRPWYHVSKEGVRLFSVIDEHGVAIAWSLYLLAIDRLAPSKAKPLPILAPVSEQSLRRALAICSNEETSSMPAGDAKEVEQILSRWMEDQKLRPDWARVLPKYRNEFEKAITIWCQRRDDVVRLIESAGYPPDDSFHAPLDTPN